MSSMRVTRPRIDVGHELARERRRTLLLTSLLCAVVFVCAYALGHHERPSAAPAEQVPGLSAAATGASIPGALGAPSSLAIEVPVVVARTAPAGRSAGRPGTTTPVQATGAIQPASSRTSAPATVPAPKPVAPVRAPAPAAPVRPSGGTSEPSKSGSKGAGGSATPKSGGSTSFENSG
jgi:hypothetical protein